MHGSLERQDRPTWHREGYDYLTGGIRSADGKIRVSDRDASGTVFTNGVATLLLKPLPEALRPGDKQLTRELAGMGVQRMI